MVASFQTLPANVLEVIFSSFNFRQLKTLSLVCKQWLHEIDYHWRNKVVLNSKHFKNADNLEIITRSNRTFLNLYFDHEAPVEHLLELLNILRTNEENKGKSFRIQYLNIFYYKRSDVCAILKLVGDCVKDLSITFNLEKEELSTEEENLDLKNLRSVETLSLCNEDKGFIKIANSFKNLVKLTIGNFHSETTKVLIENSLESLQDFSITFSDFPEENENSFKYLENLKNLTNFRFLNYDNSTNFHRVILSNQNSIRTLNLTTRDLQDSDFSNIKANCPYLENLSISGINPGTPCSKNALRSIFQIKSLASVELYGLNYSKTDFLASIEKNNLTSIVISECFFDDQIAEKLFKNSPNLTLFIVSIIEGGETTFRTVQDACEYLKDLEYLSVSSKHLDTRENLKNNTLETLAFQRLKLLNLFHSKIDNEFVKVIKAKNLQSLDLSQCETLDDHTLGVLSRSCPNIESLELFGCEKITDSGMDHVCKNLPYLTNIVCYLCKVSLESLEHILKNCKHLDAVDFRNINNEERFEEKVQEASQR